MGSRPEDLLVEPVLEQRRQLVLAEAEQQLVQKLGSLSSHQLCIRCRHGSSHFRRSSCCSIRRRLRNHKLPELLLPDGGLIDHSQPKHKSEQLQHMGCSSSDSCEAGHRFHRQPLCELFRQSRSEHR